jgi:hypothetical protein
MCFDLEYQKMCSEVKTTIEELFSQPNNSADEILKKRIGPFLGIEKY